MDAISETLLKINFHNTCSTPTIGTESSFHQLSPYIGKIKSSIAKFLIENFTTSGQTIFDPFCGAGTIPLEAWSLNRRVYANDLNKYAMILTKAKLQVPVSLEEVLTNIEKCFIEIELIKNTVDLRKVPLWVRKFFHNETLREIIACFIILENKEDYFLTACLLGILHHQRPGFLSYPSSHTVPYLRINKFPRNQYPSLYEYRPVKERLIKKVFRAYRRLPEKKLNSESFFYNEDASTLILPNKVDAIISSPPYMRQLDYARDNRLRLWFLNISNHKELDLTISPKEDFFLATMRKCLENWYNQLNDDGKCILFLGDNYSKKYRLRLPEIIEKMAILDLKKYKLIFKHQSIIPDNRRVRRNHSGNKFETILVFEKT